MRIAAAQSNPRLGDLHYNLQQHTLQAEAAAEQGASLVLFPELSLTGYALRDLVFEVALCVDDPFLDPLYKASKRIDICFGMVERTELGLFYNSQLYLSRGRLLHVHRKVFLPTYGLFEERRFFAAGKAMRAFDSPQGRLGMLICNDWWHAGGPLVLAHDGAALLLAPASSPIRGFVSPGSSGDTGAASDAPLGENSRIWYTLLAFHAKAQALPILFCNRVGFDDGIGFWGGSSLWGPDGRPVALLGEPELGLLVADLDEDALRRERVYSPLLRDEDLDLLIRELQRVRADQQQGWPSSI